MKRGIRSAYVKVVMAVVLTVGVFLVASRLTITRRAFAQVNAKSFTAETHSYSYKPGPAGSLLSKTILARRADGTTVSIKTVGPVEKGWTSRKIQYMDGRYTGVVDLISSVLRNSISEQELAGLKTRLTNPPQHCVFYPLSQTFAGYDDVLGRHLVRVVMDNPSKVSTGWHDPELGCEPLQLALEEKQSDGSRKLIARTALVGLKLGEPDERLFADAPGSYTPALTVKELEQRFGAAVKDNFPNAPVH